MIERPVASPRPGLARDARILVLLTAPLSGRMARGDDANVIDAMDSLCFQPPGNGAVGLVEGRPGSAVRFHFDKDTFGASAMSNIHGTRQWVCAAGLTFWAKGDGSDQLACLEFVFDDDDAVRYDLAFAVKAKEWRRVTVAWEDLLPVLPGPRSKILRAQSGNRPWKLSQT